MINYKIVSSVNEVLGYDDSYESILMQDLHLRSSMRVASHGWEEKWDKARYFRQQVYGDPGFFIVRDLSFIEQFDGHSWDEKFYKAREFVLKELSSRTFRTIGGAAQMWLTFIKLSEDPFRFIRPYSSPTIVLKGLPSEWVDDKSSVRNLLESLGKVSDFDMSEGNAMVQYEDDEECCKAMKKLCARYLKKNGDSRIVDFELSLKDNDGVSQDVTTSKRSRNDFGGSSSNEGRFLPAIGNSLQPLRRQVEKLEKELKDIKAIIIEVTRSGYSY